MTLKLHEAGHFTWPEWAAALSREITAAQEEGDADLGDTYYHHWLAALERIVADKGIATAAALRDRKDAWESAAAATAHGKPIELGAEKS